MSVKPLSALAGLALILAAGCSQQATREAQAKIDSLTQVATDRDRLMSEVALNARALSEIGAELSKVQVHGKLKLPPAESKEQAQRDSIVQRVHFLASRVNETDARLKESDKEIKSMSHLSDSLRATLESTVVNFQHMVDDQKGQIATLTQQVDSLSGLTVALRDTLNDVSLRSNTVYYIVGTKEQLEQKGIITEEGGARFLFVLWKSGKTMVPARTLDPSAFTAIDKRLITNIPLPDSAASYRIVSRNDLAALAAPPDPDPWIARDKALHFTACAGISGAMYGLTALGTPDIRW
ncbi:MAG TPA: hypothetical protein VFK78_02030, partial [Gemmatimonadales bacterium]|nr:hypothetical protein [Gemmatimonadales bacterium]